MNITIQVTTTKLGETAHIARMLERIVGHLGGSPQSFEPDDPANPLGDPGPEGPEEIVTLTELARRLDVTRQWMRAVAQNPGFPLSHDENGRTRIPLRAAIKWLQEFGSPAIVRRTAHIPIYPDITQKEASAHASSDRQGVDESVHQESDDTAMA